MKVVSVLLAILAVSMVSCGLDTVDTLGQPTGVSYALQNGNYKALTFTQSNQYAGTDFQGYEVYYRVYPAGTVQSQLLTDLTTLSDGPLSTLMAMGYVSFSQSSSQDSSSVTDALRIEGLAEGDTVTLDFNDFFDATNASSKVNQPVLKVNNAVRYIYRSPTLSGLGVDGLQKFSTLRTDGTLRSDTKVLSTASPYRYEIEVFIVAYGVTASIETIRSTPKAWGSIQPEGSF